jgi:hypothetical protein
MRKITMGHLVIMAVLLSACNLAAGADQQPADTQQKVENPYGGARVLVEALLVEVKLDAMEKAGVGLLSSEQPSAAKILNIIKDKNAGRIQTTAKLAVVSPGDGRMSTSGRTEVPVNQDADSNVKSWRPNEFGSNVNAHLEIWPDGRIFMVFKMELRMLSSESKAEGQSPDVLNYSWESAVSLRSGIPIIAGGMEGKDKMTYLILRADIEHDSLSQSSQQKK